MDQPEPTPPDASPFRPLVLVPGFWMGAWAWDVVVDRLEQAGADATPITLPGLESADVTRGDIGLADHIDHVLGVIEQFEEPVVLVAHSGAAAVASGVADARPDALARIVYVDAAPVADGQAILPDTPPDAEEIPLPSFDDLVAMGNSIDGLDEAARRTFTDLAVAEPAGAARDPLVVTDPARLDVPVTVICTSWPVAAVREAMAAGVPYVAEVARVADLRLVDLPTGHWPMLSKPAELAEILLAEARR